MAINNAVNASIQGLQNFNATTGAWIGRTLTSNNANFTVTNGDGTGGNPTFNFSGITQYNVLTGGAGNTFNNVAPSTSGQLFTSSGASSQPTWTTTTYPATNAINTLLYASSANVMSALATANSGVLATNASGVPSITATPTVTSITFGSGNALNTYVTGTWTPNLQINGSNTGITYTGQLGGYTQIGNVVTIWAYINLSSKGSSSGSVTISNLPVSTSSSGNYQTININLYSGLTAATYTTLSLLLGSNSSVATFYVSSATAGTAGPVTNTLISNSFNVFIQGSYILD